MKELSQHPPARGRPRSFDRHQALTQAMLLFWAHGYEGTSLTALTAAMGVTPPSLYAAFGNKEQLFLESVRLYTGDLDELEDRLDAANTAKEAAQTFLTDAALTFTGDTTPPGCLVASAAASGSPASVTVQRAVAAVRARTATAFRVRIERDIKDGRLALETDAASLALLPICLTQGMSVLARDGASRDSLLTLIGQAMTGWPDPPEHTSDHSARNQTVSRTPGATS